MITSYLLRLQHTLPGRGRQQRIWAEVLNWRTLTPQITSSCCVSTITHAANRDGWHHRDTDTAGITSRGWRWHEKQSQWKLGGLHKDSCVFKELLGRNPRRPCLLLLEIGSICCPFVFLNGRLKFRLSLGHNGSRRQNWRGRWGTCFLEWQLISVLKSTQWRGSIPRLL